MPATLASAVSRNSQPRGAVPTRPRLRGPQRWVRRAQHASPAAPRSFASDRARAPRLAGAPHPRCATRHLPGRAG
eukprot:1267164-Pyramimonas_sp.AAC.1